MLVSHRGNLLVSLFQFLHVGPLVLCILLVHLHRDDFHILLFLFPVLRQRIFNFLHIVARLQQVRRNRQGKQAALVEGVPDRAVEVLPGHQVFVVPDRDIPELLVFMDQAHQPLRVAPVFFPVAQEHVRVKRVPHLRGQFIPDQFHFYPHQLVIGLGNMVIISAGKQQPPCQRHSCPHPQQQCQRGYPHTEFQRRTRTRHN